MYVRVCVCVCVCKFEDRKGKPNIKLDIFLLRVVVISFSLHALKTKPKHVKSYACMNFLCSLFLFFIINENDDERNDPNLGFRSCRLCEQSRLA